MLGSIYVWSMCTGKQFVGSNSLQLVMVHALRRATARRASFSSMSKQSAASSPHSTKSSKNIAKQPAAGCTTESAACKSVESRCVFLDTLSNQHMLLILETIWLSYEACLSSCNWQSWSNADQLEPSRGQQTYPSTYCADLVHP